MWGIELTPDRPIGEVVDLAEAAEAAGFDAAFVSCHYNNRDPFIALDRIAAATGSIQLGPGVSNPFEAHPVTLAARMATLDEVSDGRAIFGIGAGDPSTLTNLGIDPDRPLERVLETIQVARTLWVGDRVHHDGTFAARDAGLNFSVAPLPVYVGAQGPDMLRMSGKHADGVLVNAAHPRDVSWATDRVGEGVADRSPALEPVTVVAFVSVSVAPTTEAARSAARQPVAFIAAGAAPELLDRHGLDRSRAAEIGDLVGAGEFRAAFEAVSEPMLDVFSVAGTPDRVGDRLAEIGDLVDGIVVGSPLGPDPRAAIDLLAEAVDRTALE